MSHTAHHERPTVPVYALAEAEADLKAQGHGVLEYRLGLRQYRSIYKACKLFDFDRMCWTDFDGSDSVAAPAHSAPLARYQAKKPTNSWQNTAP